MHVILLKNPWLALSNLKLASVGWHFKPLACLTVPTMFTSDLKKPWAFWVLFATAESKNTLNLLLDNPLSNPGTLESKSSANRDTWVLHAMPWPSSISTYIASSSPTIKTVPRPANSVSLMYGMILFKASSLIQVSFVESMLFVLKACIRYFLSNFYFFIMWKIFKNYEREQCEIQLSLWEVPELNMKTPKTTIMCKFRCSLLLYGLTEV